MDTNVNMNEISRICAGTVFKGEISSSNDIRIDGEFNGTINSKGRLVVGEKATVNGDVICTNVDFSGTMSKGTFYVADTLALKGGCSVDGDLRFKRLQVDLDAKINGNLRVLTDGEFDEAVTKVSAEKPAVSSKPDSPKVDSPNSSKPDSSKVKDNGTVGK